ncbi:Metal-binding protein SmbP precursor [Candidatus Methylomirabilis lanthanidiphila]|uniref:Metal-binding protein SmbP n=1 Tax=Candidatus Methylomirabilis lanthanidiphila TaxID=2211376 RepID=A0A564ZH18_9BACT|nr:hypothetical protein [Candidatus Methylomirabilis lanthanidiphila]VUZ84630.1 Metal-binding protein SmbP precursor [Candidatus Methylomirabilis lanthanidiphila]
MRRRLAAAVLVLGVITFAGMSVSWAEKSHQVQAIERTRAAIAVGKEGHKDALVELATQALQHAEAAEKAKANHMAAAVKGLMETIEHGKAGHADLAIKAAEGALEHLNAAK